MSPSIYSYSESQKLWGYKLRISAPWGKEKNLRLALEGIGYFVSITLAKREKLIGLLQEEWSTESIRYYMKCFEGSLATLYVLAISADASRGGHHRDLYAGIQKSDAHPKSLPDAARAFATALNDLSETDVMLANADNLRAVVPHLEAFSMFLGGLGNIPWPKMTEEEQTYRAVKGVVGPQEARAYMELRQNYLQTHPA